MRNLLATFAFLAILTATSYAGVSNGDTYVTPSTSPGGKVTVTVKITVKPLSGATVSVSSANGKSNKTAGAQSAGGGPEVDETENDMEVKGTDPETNEPTTGSTFRVRGGKLQVKGKNGKWTSLKPRKPNVVGAGTGEIPAPKKPTVPSGTSGTGGTLPAKSL